MTRLHNLFLLHQMQQLLNQVEQAIEQHLANLPKAEIARTSIANRGALVLVKDRQEAIELMNQVAPEHLELCMDDPQVMAEEIRHAGAIFMGRYHQKRLVIIVQGQTTYCQRRVQHVFHRHWVFMISKNAQV